MKCPRHPDIETDLRCGKCEQPICSKCLVQTPVGARCPQCAALKKLPVFEVPRIFYVRAVAAGFISAGVLGVIWPYIPFSGFLLFLIALVVGYAIGEIISLSVNRKRGPGLQAIAGVSVLVCYIIRSLFEAMPGNFLNTFLNPYGLIAAALGIIIAVGLLRRN
jgi:hypothetical protein